MYFRQHFEETTVAENNIENKCYDEKLHGDYRLYPEAFWLPEDFYESEACEVTTTTTPTTTTIAVTTTKTKTSVSKNNSILILSQFSETNLPLIYSVGGKFKDLLN